MRSFSFLSLCDVQEHMQALKQEQETIDNYKPKLDDLEASHQQIQEALIFKNPHTQYTMHVSNPFVSFFWLSMFAGFFVFLSLGVLPWLTGNLFVLGRVSVFNTNSLGLPPRTTSTPSRTRS